MAVNQFTDLTSAEFKATYLNLNAASIPKNYVETLDTTGVPSSVDWRTKGAVTDVKD
jgi:hypothetical protein